MNTIDTMSVNAIRVLSADAIQKAKSGHPGLPLGSAPAAYELWMNHMNHNPADPQWANRDRFILSGGHGSMLLYSLLHLFGYGDLSKEDLMNFPQKKADPQILSAGRIQSFQICIDIILDIKLYHLIPLPDLPDIFRQFRIRIIKFTHNLTPQHDV